ncbi:MAG: class I SAM-dependent methyltransferase [Acidobacteriota bacterium]|nr:class I SAM-dependent methyltransferase [Acidobacteriota bacterium]
MKEAMQEEDFAYLYALEESFWWFAGMREITSVLLDSELPPSQDRLILDVGCGTGGMLLWLARFAGRGRVVGIDVVPSALRFCRERHHPHLAQASATHLPFADSTFDLVTSFDVLVQLPGEGADEQAIREMYRLLRPGGVAFVRVAAYEWMRSGHDEALGTQRRYTLGALICRMEGAGFNTLRATYANTLLLPAAALRRLVLKRVGLADSGSDVKPLPSKLEWLNRLLASALASEARILRNPRTCLPAGLSAICISEKPHT